MTLTKRHVRLKKSIHTLIETNPRVIKIEVKENEFLDVEEIEKCIE